MRSVARCCTTLFLLMLLAGCSVNPVTGEREIALIGTASQIQMGEQNYLPMQQSEGGEYDIDPELTAYVSRIGQRLAAVSDAELPYEFVVLNNSVPNAWALPGGKIAVNRGLLVELQSESELAAVLGHEIVHAAAGHSARQMERGMLLQGLVLATAVATSDSDYGQMAVGGANLAGQLVTQKYGRGAELEADKYGMKYMSKAGYDPQGAVTLQQTFVRLSEGHDQGWLSGLFASHPPSQERVEANRQTAAGLPPGGDSGADRYQAALAKTEQAEPAYKAYDEGRAALAKNDKALALSKAEDAIQRLPGEAHFYALRGDVQLLNKHYDTAISDYDRAIARRDDFFYYYLQRGRAYENSGNTNAAESDLKKSLTLLPTAPAHYMLGSIAAERGNRTEALQHFGAIADGNGEVAAEAQAAIVKLDIGENPARYVQTGCDAASDGKLVVLLRNATPVTLRNIVVGVQFRDSNGGTRQLEKRISGLLPPGKVASVATGLGPYTPGTACPATVLAAQAAN